jgi:hypothetical protein
VLCVHAWPWYDTGFLGDEFCILPPPPDKGLQVGFHPQGTDYWEQLSAQDMGGYQAPDEAFIVEAGGEETRNYWIATRNAEPRNYYRTYFRMRTGSHHNIITLHEPGEGDAWVESAGDALPGLFGSPAGERIGVLGGQQRPDDSTPVTLQAPPEDEGLYLEWPVDPTVLFNLHHFNTTDGPILKEGWVNLWFAEEPETRVQWYFGMPLSQVASLEVQPQTTQDLHYRWDVTKPARLLRVFGHRHAWTSNFSSWIVRAGRDEPEPIYQSFDWFDMPTYRYDSVVNNPALNPELRVDGAVSGVLELDAGDELHFNCRVEFTEERAFAEDAPSPSAIGPLRFANEAYTGEMCIQFGNVTGAGLGTPEEDDSPVPDFAQ